MAILQPGKSQQQARDPNVWHDKQGVAWHRQEQHTQLAPLAPQPFAGPSTAQEWFQQHLIMPLVQRLDTLQSCMDLNTIGAGDVLDPRQLLQWSKTQGVL